MTYVPLRRPGSRGQGRKRMFAQLDEPLSVMGKFGGSIRITGAPKELRDLPPKKPITLVKMSWDK